MGSDSLTDPLRRPLWSEREFAFVHPPWRLADFVERLAGAPARLEERVRGLEPSLACEPLEGAWSIQQHAGHLSDLEELWRTRILDLRRGARVHTPADFAFLAERARRHQERGMAEVLAEFRAKRAELVSVLAAADPDLQQRSAFHERLGCAMRLVDVAQFAAEHDDHHLLRIARLRERLGG